VIRLSVFYAPDGQYFSTFVFASLIPSREKVGKLLINAYFCVVSSTPMQPPAVPHQI